VIDRQRDRSEGAWPFARAYVILAIALAVTAGLFLSVTLAFLQDWRALLVFFILPAITVALVLLAALKQ
jgi:hypothetical protein